MPARGHRKSDPLNRRVRVQLTAAQAVRLAELAHAAGVSRSDYMRRLLAALDGASKVPKARRPSAAMLQLVEIHELAMQVKKLGTNINQLARQANTGIVPLTRAEVEDMLVRHEELMRKAVTLIEQVLPG